MVDVHGRELPKEKWQPFFDRVSASLEGKGVDITIHTHDIHQHQSQVWELNGVSYDPHDDALIVSCRRQEHVISSPVAITVHGNGEVVSSIDVLTAEGPRETVKFIAPILLSQRIEGARL
jgi:hypothetical protein